MPLIVYTPQGLYCPEGGFHIDPSRAVETALITHAHSDHARRGSRHYTCASSGVGLLKTRLGDSIRVTGVRYGEEFQLGQTRVSFHPAGHILGSAQIRVQAFGEVWVVSGDYKRVPDPSCEPFESVPCDAFITEATFGQPIYEWERDQEIGAEVGSWWRSNAERGRNSVLYCYSLGKAQRLLAELLDHADRPILLHGSMESLTDCYRQEGIGMAETVPLDGALERLSSGRELVLAPPSQSRTEWMGRLGAHRTAFASGWMRAGRRGMGSYDDGFVVSDHADWPDLLRTISETGARRVFVMHAQDATLVRHLRKAGLEAHPVEALDPGGTEAVKPRQLALL